MKHKYCDGSTIEFEPDYEDVECFECGSIIDKRITNTPNFHKGPLIETGPNTSLCKTCNSTIEDLHTLLDNVEQSYAKLLEESFRTVDLFYRALESGKKIDIINEKLRIPIKVE